MRQGIHENRAQQPRKWGSRPKVIRALFKELRGQLGDEVTTREALLAAEAIAEIVSPTAVPQKGGPRFYTGGLPFERWDLDRAMATHGGWKTMSLENELRSYAAEESFDSFETQNSLKDWMMENAA